MSSTRAAAVLVIATTLYGVTFAVDQWLLLIGVFVLTLAALYGLGMMLASLFLMWGREAWHLTQLLDRAGLLRVRAQLPDRPARRARLGRDQRAAARGRAGRDAPARVRRRRRTRSGRRRRRSRLRSSSSWWSCSSGCPALDARRSWSGGPARRAGSRCAGSDAGAGPMTATVDSGRAPPGSRRLSGAASTRPERAAAASPSCARRSGPRSVSAGRWRRTGPTRSCSSSTRSRSRSASALILVVMLDVISGGGRAGVPRPSSSIGSALWSFVLSGVSGLAWMILDDRERYRMLKYVYVSPSEFLAVVFGRGVARIGVGAMGAAITLVVGVAVARRPVRHRPRRLGRSWRS